MARPLIIVTVGTSLLSNTGTKPGASSVRTCTPLNNLNSACGAVNHNQVTPDTRDDLKVKLNPFAQEYNRELSYRSNSDMADRLPQELSYLFALRDRDYGGCGDPCADLLLLASETPKGKLCSAVISDTIKCHIPQFGLVNETANHGIIGEIKGVRVIEGLDGSFGTFSEQALPAIVQAVTYWVEQLKPDKVIMNPTGGFKGIIPYCTLILHALHADEVQLHYLFETSTDIAELPCYPVGLDFTRWHREQALLGAYVSADDADWGKSYATALDPRMRAVAEEKKRNPTGETLSAIYERQYTEIRARDPLQSYSERVIQQFLPENTLSTEASAWRNKLLELLPRVGPLIWHGDKLPMAANHAVDHHHDLLQIAQLLLTPIADAEVTPRKTCCENDNGHCFLNNAERIALLCAIMLHDSGHTLDRLPLDGREVVLFPSEIRKHHHYLGYRRLNSGMLKTSIDWEPPDTNGLWEVIQHLCYHHRKSTGWNECDEIYQDYATILFPRPLKYSIPSFWQYVDYPKLVALLRLIDGCDNQSIRVGGAKGWDIMRKQLDDDCESWRHRLRELLSLTSDTLNTDAMWRDVHDHLCRGTNLPEINWKTRIEKEKETTATDSSVSRKARMWLELARTCDEYAIRNGQYVHFLRHALVAGVAIRPARDFDLASKWSFDILFEVTDQKLWDLSESEDKDSSTKVRQWIEGDVKSEIGIDQLRYLQAYVTEFTLNYAWLRPNLTPEVWC